MEITLEFLLVFGGFLLGVFTTTTIIVLTWTCAMIWGYYTKAIEDTSWVELMKMKLKL